MHPVESLLVDATIKAAAEFESGKSLRDIQYETALTWAGRALRSYELYARSGDPELILDACEYDHEAREHAALVDDADFASAIGAHLTRARNTAGF